jgi:hypothetical protein
LQGKLEEKPNIILDGCRENKQIFIQACPGNGHVLISVNLMSKLIIHWVGSGNLFQL